MTIMEWLKMYVIVMNWDESLLDTNIEVASFAEMLRARLGGASK